MDKEDELLFAMNTRLTKVKIGQESDCSGSVCGALSVALGKHIRITADELYRKYFTKAYAGGIHAAFFLDGNEKAVHVAGGLYGKLYHSKPALHS
jgi:hypothetical protein